MSGTACDTLGRCDECFQHELASGLGLAECGAPPREPITYCLGPGSNLQERARAACEACLGGVCTEVLCEGAGAYTRTGIGPTLMYMFEPGGCALPGQVYSQITDTPTHTFE